MTFNSQNSWVCLSEKAGHKFKFAVSHVDILPSMRYLSGYFSAKLASNSSAWLGACQTDP